MGKVSGRGLGLDHDYGLFFFKNGISIWHLLYTVIHDHLKIYYLHYPSCMLED